ncbi:hypothetical protein GHT06_008356 [Daphnia sinensis]|uniref:Mitochondria-eating protein n=1 Tax=Daphnia sinensis TaxID=1820382 RepID=A0AAD5Q2N0_9CRUS|nr:hypothetical protein GHT06_008356 [Daphnia sinensis]
MAPIHQRMDRYHDLPPPPPIPLKLKPKTLKKLSQQAARGQPLYLIVGPHSAAAGGPRPMPNAMHPPPLPQHPPHPNHPSRNFAVVHPRVERQQRMSALMAGPANSVGTATSGSDSMKSMSFSSAQGLMDSQNRFRGDNFNSRLRAHQQLFPWNPHNQKNSQSSKSSSNWVRHLTSDDDVEEEEEEEEEEPRGAGGHRPINNSKADTVSCMEAVTTRTSSGVRPEYQLGPSDRNARLVGEIQLSSRVASMTIADVSPRFAFKKIMMLSENKQYRESANFINRLSGGTFGVIVHDLPVDQFIESMPQSLPIIESLYTKVFLSDGMTRNSIQFLRPENVVQQMVKYFAHQEDHPPTPSGGSASGWPPNVWRWDYCGPFISSCKKLLRVIVLTEPKIRKSLFQKRRALGKAIEGLGQHGLVGTSDENLMNLHDALQDEFNRVVQSYKSALDKMVELELAQKKGANRTVSNGPAPIAASHQRLLSLKQSEIQERLIKNKTLLNVVEPTLTNHSLDLFLGILQRRIELDKEALFQFSQLKRDQPAKPGEAIQNIVVAPILMKYSHGCQQVLELMREVSSDQNPQEDDLEDSSDVSGYHSDSDSAVMMSGNSPFVSKSARYNFLSRSVRLGSRASIRASLLVNSLGLEAGEIKEQSGQGQGQSRNGRRMLLAKAKNVSMSSSTGSNSPSSERESDYRSSGISSGTGSPDSRQALANDAGRLANTPPCQRCQVQNLNNTIVGTHGVDPGLQAELESIKAEMNKANATICALQEREKKMKASRMALQAQKMVERGVGPSKFESISSEQRSDLIQNYGGLYTQSRVETLDYLDKLEELRGADELKSKLLFSVIVLAFRSLQATSTQMKDHIKRILQIPPGPMHQPVNTNNAVYLPPAPPPPPSALAGPSNSKRQITPPAKPAKPAKPLRKERNPGYEVEQAVAYYLRESVATFDLTKNTEDVCNQIWATLYDYPCLRSCEPLVKYIKDSVRLAWSLVNQSPPYVLDYEARSFNADYHIRFHTSDPNDNSIKTYLWPALVEGHNGPCLQKAVVIT